MESQKKVQSLKHNICSLLAFWQNIERRAVILESVFMTANSSGSEAEKSFSSVSQVTQSEQLLLMWPPGLLTSLLHVEILALNVPIDELRMKCY